MLNLGAGARNSERVSCQEVEGTASQQQPSAELAERENEKTLSDAFLASAQDLLQPHFATELVVAMRLLCSLQSWIVVPLSKKYMFSKDLLSTTRWRPERWQSEKSLLSMATQPVPVMTRDSQPSSAAARALRYTEGSPTAQLKSAKLIHSDTQISTTFAHRWFGPYAALNA